MNSKKSGSPGDDSTVTYRLLAKLRDRKRLDEVKRFLASIPPERRSAVARRALALAMQRRAGQGPSTYLAAALAQRASSQTKSSAEE